MKDLYVKMTKKDLETKEHLEKVEYQGNASNTRQCISNLLHQI